MMDAHLDVVVQTDSHQYECADRYNHLVIDWTHVQDCVFTLRRRGEVEMRKEKK